MAITNRQLVMLGAGISLVAILVAQFSLRRRNQHSEQSLDEALADSFPASDPVATQDYSIPANRLDPAADRSS